MGFNSGFKGLITELLLSRAILFIAEVFSFVLKYLFVVVLLLQLKSNDNDPCRNAYAFFF